MKDKIIQAIQSQNMIRVSFQKETTGEYVTRDVIPYDIYPRKKKDSWYEEDYILGYTDIHLSHNPHPFATYLSNIRSVETLSEKFDGRAITQILKPKEPPVVLRNW
jgi:hypothetical protein